MKCNMSKNVKISLIIALCVILVGMIFLGVFGFNKTVDNSASYEVFVGVDQNLNQAGDKVKETAENYFDEIGVDYFKVVALDDGAAYIYTFNENKVEAEVLRDKIQTAVGDVVVAECEVKVLYPSQTNQALYTLLALAVATVAIIVYLIFTAKPAATFTVILNAILASILTTALLALTRIPVYGDVEIYIVASFVLSAILSVVITNRLKEITSIVGNEKLPYDEIVNRGVKDSTFRILAFLVLIVLSAIAVIVCFLPHLVYTSVCVLILGVSAVFASLLGTAIFWPMLKSVKRKA